jgi:hypothetical protein
LIFIVIIISSSSSSSRRRRRRQQNAENGVFSVFGRVDVENFLQSKRQNTACRFSLGFVVLFLGLSWSR